MAGSPHYNPAAVADTVSVTQADRNDAADYGKAMQTLTGRERDSILRGKWDSSAPVQWFARRRLASTQPAPEFPREEVRGLVAGAGGTHARIEAATDAIAALLQGKQP